MNAQQEKIYNKLWQQAHGGVLIGGTRLKQDLKKNLIQNVATVQDIDTDKASALIKNALQLFGKDKAAYYKTWDKASPDIMVRLTAQLLDQYRNSLKSSSSTGSTLGSELTIKDFIDPNPALYNADFINNITDPDLILDDPAAELQRRQKAAANYLKITGAKPKFDPDYAERMKSELDDLKNDIFVTRKKLSIQMSKLNKKKAEFDNEKAVYDEYLNNTYLIGDDGRPTATQYSTLAKEFNDEYDANYARHEKEKKDLGKIRERFETLGFGKDKAKHKRMPSAFNKKVKAYMKKHGVTLAKASKAVSKGKK